MYSNLLSNLAGVFVFGPILMGTMVCAANARVFSMLLPDIIDRMVKGEQSVRLALPNDFNRSFGSPCGNSWRSPQSRGTGAPGGLVQFLDQLKKQKCLSEAGSRS